MTEKLGPCTCGNDKKLAGSLLFGYLTITCRECGRNLTSEGRSGNETYLLETEMIKRWNDGERDEKPEA